MFYQYFIPINILFTIFGLKKMFILSSGRSCKITIWNKLWSLLIILFILASFTVSLSSTVDWNIRKNLENVSRINYVIVHISVIFSNLINNETVCVQLYTLVEIILRDLKFSKNSLKLISMKIYLWISVTTLMFIVVIVLEIVYSDPPFYILLTGVPTFLSIVHLEFNLYLLVAILNDMNTIMSKKLTFHETRDVFIIEAPTKLDRFKYLFNPNISFIKITEEYNFDLKLLCRLYDDLSTCMQLLEEHHGFQILLTIWLMFSSAVIGVTQIICKQAKIPWLVVTRIILPFFWCFIGCYIDDQMRKEVEQTDTLIVKYLIDFRCDQPRRNMLQTFKQVVSTNRLQFTASSLFHLNYAMILGTIMNVITYSIILVQLFITDN